MPTTSLLVSQDYIAPMLNIASPSLDGATISTPSNCNRPALPATTTTTTTVHAADSTHNNNDGAGAGSSSSSSTSSSSVLLDHVKPRPVLTSPPSIFIGDDDEDGGGDDVRSVSSSAANSPDCTGTTSVNVAATATQGGGGRMVISSNSPRPALRPLETVKSSDCLENLLSPSMRSSGGTPRVGGGGGQTSSNSAFETHPMVVEAWEKLLKSLVYFRGVPVGTIAALDSTEEALNYNQVFVRDFVPSALAFLMNGQPEIVKNFLLKALRLQAREKRIDWFTLGEGVMPASFKVVMTDPIRKNDTIIPDFGESAIGRVAPVDSGFWWIILLRAYTKSTGDYTLAETPDCQRGMRLILSICLAEGFDTFPTLLCADGCCMIDRRMGIYGSPIEIQALFFLALRCARVLLKPEAGGKEFIERIDKRLHALSFHIRSYFWLDFQQLNNIYRYKTEEYSHTAVNKFNVIPDSIPDWVFDFMPMKGGYFIGNVSPARMDFRWFCLGNCVAILGSLATPEQEAAIMDLFEARWSDLVGEMPLKIAFPALEGNEWKIVTGSDPKNTRWSYHNGGSWPVLLWLLTAACIKTGRPQIARRAIELAESRLSRDSWAEYYDGKLGRYVGKQARKFQTWSIAGYLVAKMLLEDPSHLGMIALEDDKKMKPAMTRSASWTV